MNFRPVLIALLLMSTAFVTAQSCVCASSKALLERIESYYKEGKTDSVTSVWSRFNVNSPPCYQELCLAKSRFFEKKAKPDSLNKWNQELSKSLITNPCTSNLLWNIHYKGIFYVSTAQFDSATVWFIKLLDLSKEEHDTSRMIRAYQDLAFVFSNIMQFSKAIDYTKRAIYLSQRTGDISNELRSWNNLVFTYGSKFEETKNEAYLDSVLTTALSTVEKAKKVDQTDELIRSYGALSAFYYVTGSYKKAIDYSDSVITNGDPVRHVQQLHMAYFNKCDILLVQKNYKEAKRSIDSALAIASRAKQLAMYFNTYVRLYEIEKLQGNYKTALDYYEIYTRMSDSLKSKEQLQVVTDLEQRYNKVQNEKTISELTQDSQIKELRIRILLVGVLLAIVSILAIVFFYRQRLIRSKQEQMEIEQRLNRSRMNPHFFFNALSTLQGMALKENDGKKLAVHLYKFSNLMRKTLEGSYQEMVTVKEEMEFIKVYMDLQELKEPGRFALVENSEEEGFSNMLIPSMIIQPFLENSIEHGFKNIEHKGLIELTFAKHDGHLVLTIKDNGAGLQKKDVDKGSLHISRATQITRDRIFLLNKRYRSNASFVVLQNEPKGVKVEIILPLISS